MCPIILRNCEGLWVNPFSPCKIIRRKQNGLVLKTKSKQITEKENRKHKVKRERGSYLAFQAAQLAAQQAGPAQLPACRLPPRASGHEGVWPPRAPTRLATSCLVGLPDPSGRRHAPPRALSLLPPCSSPPLSLSRDNRAELVATARRCRTHSLPRASPT